MQRYKFGIKIMKNLFIESYEPMFNKAKCQYSTVYLVIHFCGYQMINTSYERHLP